MEATIASTFRFPASANQQRLWVLSRFTAIAGAYNMCGVLEISGEINAIALRESLEQISHRHESLRTSFEERDGVLYQIVHETHRFTFTEQRLENEAELEDFIQRQAESRFDLQKENLFSVHILTNHKSGSSVMMNLHHIVADGWSLEILLRELAQAYSLLIGSSAAKIFKSGIQYVDYTNWEIENSNNPFIINQHIFWKKYLANSQGNIKLPELALKNESGTYEGKIKRITVADSLLRKIETITHQKNTSVFTLLFSAFAVLLHKYSQQKDIIVGTYFANREREDLQDMVGFLVKTLPVRIIFTVDMTFSDVINSVRSDLVKILNNKDLSFSEIIAASEVQRSMNRNPLFQTLFTLENISDQDLIFDNMPAKLRKVDGLYSKFDLSASCYMHSGSLRFDLEYRTAIFESYFIEVLADGFLSLIEEVVDAPDKKIVGISGLSAVQQQKLLLTYNQTTVQYSPGDIIDYFQRSAGAYPDHIACICDNVKWTYRELDNLSDQYAYRFSQVDVKPGDFIALIFERNSVLLPVMLGILKLGAAYVPIDPVLPKDRIRYLVTHSESKFIITHDTLLTYCNSLDVPVPICVADYLVPLYGSEKIFTLSASLPARKTAYCIYTSGSTGIPKGVRIPHSALINFLLSMRDAPGMQPGESILAVTSISFDISCLELFLPLVSGGTTIILNYNTVRDPQQLIAAINVHAPTLIQATPTLFNNLRQAGWSGESGIKLLCGGEMLSYELAAWLRQRCAALWNMYGPTETTIWSCIYEWQAEFENVPAGNPISNTQVYILNEDLAPVPPMAEGELFIGGSGLAECYHNDAALTTEKFIDWNYLGESRRLYRTGDGAKFDKDGAVIITGRRDLQFKIAGFRVEPGEIESALRRIPGISNALVIPQVESGEENSSSIIAYLETLSAHFSVKEARTFLARHLPFYMIPSVFIPVPSFPQTPNGKTDRKKLMQINAAEILPGPTINKKPETENEVLLTHIWEEELKISGIGIDDDFIILGGNSIAAVRIVSKAEASGIRMTPEMLFEFTTIRKLGAEIRRSQSQTVLGLAGHTSQEVPTDARTVQLQKQNTTNMLIESMDYFLPEKEVFSKDIVDNCKHFFKFPIERLTGIQSVHQLDEGQGTFDLAIRAVDNCFKRSRYLPDEIDIIISCGMGRLEREKKIQIDPNLSFRVKHYFNMYNAANFDVSNACAGLFTGLVFAESLLKNGTARRCLVFSAEYISHCTNVAQKEVMNFSDTRLAGLTIGDAGFAMIVELSEKPGDGFEKLDLFTMGAYSDLCVGRPSREDHGGFTMFTDAIKMSEAGYMAAAKHALSTITGKEGQMLPFDHFIMHQASSTTMLNSAREINKLFGAPLLEESKIVNNIRNRGNTASTAYFIALLDNILSGRISNNESVLFSVSGSGLNLGTALYKLDGLPGRIRNAAAGSVRNADISFDAVPAVRKIEPGISISHLNIQYADDICNTGLAMLAGAAEQTLIQSGIDRKNIDLVLYYGTFRDDYIFEPASASFLTGYLGINASKEDVQQGYASFAFDVYQGRLGFLFACFIAASMISSGRSETSLVASSETDTNKKNDFDPLNIVEAGTAFVLTKSSQARKGFAGFLFKSFKSEYAEHQYSICSAHWEGKRIKAIKEIEEPLTDLLFEEIQSCVTQLLISGGLAFPQFDFLICSRRIDDTFPTWMKEANVMEGLLAWPDKDLYNLALPVQLDLFLKSISSDYSGVGLLVDLSNSQAGWEMVCALYYL